MKKLFISQPMRDKTDEEIIAERERAIESAKKHLGDDVEVIDSFFKDAPHDAKPLWYLAKSLELLSTADIAYFCKDGISTEDARLKILALSNTALMSLKITGRNDL